MWSVGGQMCRQRSGQEFFDGSMLHVHGATVFGRRTAGLDEAVPAIARRDSGNTWSDWAYAARRTAKSSEIGARRAQQATAWIELRRSRRDLRPHRHGGLRTGKVGHTRWIDD
jgi:hypothetical protein